MMWRRLLLLACVSTALAACGGGAGGDATTTAPQSNRNPVAGMAPLDTAVVGAPLLLDGSSSSDPDGDALSYTWALTSAPQGSAAALTDPTTSKASLTPDIAGSYAFTLTVRDGRSGSATTTATVAAIAVASAYSIAATPDSQRPVVQTLALTPAPGVAAPASVTWFVDLKEIGTTTAAAGHSINWDSTGAAGGDHQVLARLRTPATATTYQDLIRTVRLDSSDITLNAAPLGLFAPYAVQVRASAPAGIRSVSARFDTTDLGSLAAPNACALGCEQPFDVYRFAVANTLATSGTHRVVVVATDNHGLTRTSSFDWSIANKPQLQLVSPADGIMAFGSLRVTGSTSTDRTGAVTVRVRLASAADPFGVEVLSTTSASFDANIDLTGVSAGAYTLTVTATDSYTASTEVRRSVVVMASAAQVATPVASIAAGGSVRAFDGRRIVVVAADDSAYVRDLVSGTDVPLASSSALVSAGDWTLVGTDAVATGRGPDCPDTGRCVYLWNAAGAITNLTKANPYSRTTTGWTWDQLPKAQGDFIIWYNNLAQAVVGGLPTEGRFTYYRRSSGTFGRIDPPAGAQQGVLEADLTVDASNTARLYFGAITGTPDKPLSNVYEWRSDTLALRLMTDNVRSNARPLTDGTRLAWKAGPLGAGGSTFWLLSQPLPNGTAGMVSDKAMYDFVLRDGLLAWIEGNGATVAALSASTWLNGVEKVYPIATQRDAGLYDVSDGHVVYRQGGKVYTWNAARADSTLRLPMEPTGVFARNGWLLFVVGTFAYRVPIN